jgi:hypothetical protein
MQGGLRLRALEQFEMVWPGFGCSMYAYGSRAYLPTKVVPIATVAENWEAPGKPRLVFLLRESL